MERETLIYVVAFFTLLNTGLLLLAIRKKQKVIAVVPTRPVDAEFDVLDMAANLLAKRDTNQLQQIFVMLDTVQLSLDDAAITARAVANDLAASHRAADEVDDDADHGAAADAASKTPNEES